MIVRGSYVISIFMFDFVSFLNNNLLLFQLFRESHH